MGLVNIFYTIVMGRPIGITSFFYLLGQSIIHRLQMYPVGRHFFQHLSHQHQSLFLLSLFSLGLIAGSLLSAILQGEFRLRSRLSLSRFFLALCGGLLMGYGAYIARGCNIGAMVGGIASFSLHGWIFGISLCVGVFIAGHILKRLI